MNGRPTHQIVIVGAGFAGLRVALELEKRRVRRGDCKITIIDREPHHVYWPLLYEVCSGALEDTKPDCAGQLRAGVCIRFDEYRTILRRNHARFIRGEVTGMDAEKKELFLKDGSTVPFDDLVVSPGSVSATYGIPGIAEHAYTMKTMHDAMNIRSHIAGYLKAYAQGDEKRISVMIGGGGATGTEFAAELGHFFQKLVREGILKKGDYDLALIEAGPDILSMFPERMRQSARRRLESLGVTVMSGTKILEVKQGAIRVALADGKEETHETDVMVWTGGIKPSPLVAALKLPTDEKGYVSIEPTFEVKGMTETYALGDCVSYVHPKSGKRVPALGQAAVKEGAIVAENIVRHLERKPPVTWTPPERWITVVPLGGMYALADFGWFHLGGFVGYTIRKAADFLYFFSMLPPARAWQMWSRGARVYLQND